jgi:uncharacterized membrane protein
MSLWLLLVLQWLHVFLGIFWFGAVLYSDFVLVPVIQGLQPATQLEVAGPLGRRTVQVIIPVALGVIVLGVLRGVAGGVLGALGSAYGLTWLASLVVGCVTLAWGVWVVTPAINRIQEVEPGSPAVAVAISRVQFLAILELGLFLVILSLMIALRFGY